MFKKNILWKITIAGLLVAAFSLYLYWGNNDITTTHHTYSNEDIPESFDGYKIVQVSDLHNKEFDGELVSRIVSEKPDIIAVTGDLIDRNRTNLDVARDFLEEITDIAPVYFVSGNHEFASNKYQEVQDILDDTGVVNLDDSNELLGQGDEGINLIGIADPLTLLYEEIEEEGSMEKVLENRIDVLLNKEPSHFSILLSHRAELMEVYEHTEVPLVLTGHAHGGQIRLPFIKGLYAPSQGFFPEYTSDTYTEGETTMVVSRGLGNSIFPLRVLNRPELVVITLESE